MTGGTTELNNLEVVGPCLSKALVLDMNLNFQNLLRHINGICSPHPSCVLPAGNGKDMRSFIKLSLTNFLAILIIK